MSKSYVLHIFVVLMVISILLLVSNNIPGVRVFKNVFIKIMFPVSKVVDYPAITAGSIYSRSKSLLNSYDENIMLKRKIKLLKMKYMDIKYLKKEHERLNNLLGFKNTSFGNLITAEVLIQYPENYFAEFNINKGEIHGIKKDCPVISMLDSRWVLIGRVGEVFKDFSKVVLITSADFRCAVDVSDYRGVIKGNNNWLLKLDYISPDADIAEGDDVYNSGTGGIFPGGLYIGNIITVNELEFSTGKKGVVRGAYYPQNAKYVYVIGNRESEK